MKLSIVIFLSLVVHFACNENSTIPQTTGSGFKGIVKDVNGTLINDVNIFLIFDFETVTNKLTVPFTPDSVHLLSFTASANGNNVILNWSTESELNNHGFEIQKKHFSENQFYNIGFVEGAGTSDSIHNYSYTDVALLAGVNIYRLKQIDFDGAYNYSSIIEVDIVPPIAFNFNQNYPNPFVANTKLSYTLAQNSLVKILVHSFFAKDTISVLVNEQKYAGIYNFDLFPLSLLPNNLYEVEFIAEYENQVYKKVMTVMKNYTNQNNIHSVDRSYSQTSNGQFLIDYSKMAFNKTFDYTNETSPEVRGKLKVRPNLTILLYKQGYKSLVKNFELDINSYKEEEFILSFE